MASRGTIVASVDVPHRKDEIRAGGSGRTGWLRRLFRVRIAVVILVAGAVLPMLAMRTGDIVATRNAEIAAARRTALDFARDGARRQATVLSQARAMVDVLAEVPFIRAVDEPPCHELLHRLKEGSSWSMGIGVIGLDGVPVCGDRAREFRTVNLADRAYFKAALQARSVVVSEPIIARSTQKEINGRLTIIVAKAARDAEGAPSGVVFAAVDLMWVRQLIGDASRTANGEVLLLDRQGLVLAMAPDPDHLTGQALPAGDGRQPPLDAAEGVFEGTTTDGRTLLAGFAAVPDTGGRLIVAFPKASVVAEADAELARSAWHLAALACGLALLMWLGAEFAVLRWIKALKRAAERLREGDFSARAALPPTAGELELVGRALDTAAQTLGERHAALTAAEAAAREANRMLRLAEEVSHAGHWRLDLPSGRLIWSDEIYRIHGLDSRAYVPRVETAIEAYHPDDRAEVTRCVQEALDAKKSYEFKLRILRPNGEVRHVLSRGFCEIEPATGMVCGLFGTLLDVTELHDAEARLRESESRWNFALESARQGVWDHDVPSGRTFYSPTWKKILGYGETELGDAADLWKRLIHPEDLPHVEAAEADHAAGRTPFFQCEFRMRTKAGGWVWILDLGKVIARDAQGRPLRMIGTHTDITERKEIEEALRLEKTRAEEAARIKADFLANMSHELRTPLTGIIGAADVLLQDGPGNLAPVQRQIVEMQRDAGRSLLGVINDILDFSKIEAGQIAIEALAFDSRDLVETCIATVSSEARRKALALDVAVAADVDPVLVGDAGRIRQVLLNFLSNAIKFTPQGGRVAVSVTRAAGAGVRFAVEDTGIGIEPEALARLFERFAQADASTTRRFGGSGLGLSICAGLVEAMGGTIDTTSTPGAGSTFAFTLPLGPAAATASSARQQDVQPGLDRPLAVLLAEDNPMNRQLVQLMLERAGCNVALAGTGAEALEALTSDAAPLPDIVLMDVQMPVMDGYEATRRIRQALGRRTPPIVALTANAVASEIERCFAAGMDAHVAKPVNWTELFAAMTRLCARDAPVFDPARLEEIRSALGPSKTRDILDLFRSELAQRLAAMSRTDAGPADIAREAHSLAASSGNLGCEEILAICRKMSELGAGDAAKAGRLVTALEAAALRAGATLHSWASAA